MEYYAKSKEKELSKKEKEKLIDILHETLQDLDTGLEDWEKKRIRAGIQTLQNVSNSHQKTLQEHQDDIVRCAEKFFEQYGTYFTEKEKALVTEACRLHDWGKANLIFQSLVNPEVKERLPVRSRNVRQIPHGFLSAVSISAKEFKRLSVLFEEEDFYAFFTAIYHHHTRDDEVVPEQIKQYCEDFYAKQIKEYQKRDKWKPYCSSIGTYLLFRNRKREFNYIPESDKWNQYLLIKGLLNKFDYTVSAGYDKAEEDSDLKEKILVDHIERSLKNYKLRPAQEYMKENPDKNLVIIAPTGSGKTEAALLWLNGEKGFYTLPLKVSSNAIYKRIKDNYSYEHVSLLHSDSMQKYLEEYADSSVAVYEKYERAKLLSNPLTVCTVDQLFKFVYKALGTEIFAATLKYSKVVLDEIQAYSPRVIATIIYGLKTITDMGGHFAIITATFPPVLQHFMERYGLVQGQQYLFHDFSNTAESLRHKVAIRKGEMNVDELREQGKNKKVLVICNTVSKAQEIYTKLIEWTEDVYLLHSRYIRGDREMLEKMIMDFSIDQEAKGIWITTQIVEASLDIDFDVLYTEMCTADSLLQRMGRCNRNRKEQYVPKEANIIVYDNENGVGPNAVYEKYLYERSLVELYKYENMLFSESMKIEYINRVYCAEEVRESHYYKEIERYLEHFAAVHPSEYSKQEADKEFRNIHSITVIPDSVYNANQNLIENSLDILRVPYIGREIKNVFVAKLNSLTLSLNCYGKLPAGVDRATMGETEKDKGSAIHRTRMTYDFDRDKGKGCGLLLNQIEDETYLV